MALQSTLLVLSIATTSLGMVALFFRMGSQFGTVVARLDGLDARAVGIDRRFDGVDARLDRVDARLDRVDGRLDRVEDRLGRVEDRLTGVQVDVARIGQKLDVHVLDPRGHQVA